MSWMRGTQDVEILIRMEIDCDDGFSRLLERLRTETFLYLCINYMITFPDLDMHHLTEIEGRAII